MKAEVVELRSRLAEVERERDQWRAKSRDNIARVHAALMRAGGKAGAELDTAIDRIRTERDAVIRERDAHLADAAKWTAAWFELAAERDGLNALADRLMRERDTALSRAETAEEQLATATARAEAAEKDRDALRSLIDKAREGHGDPISAAVFAIVRNDAAATERERIAAWLEEQAVDMGFAALNAPTAREAGSCNQEQRTRAVEDIRALAHHATEDQEK